MLDRTATTGCPACVSRTLHREADWGHHPTAGHGYTSEGGWSSEAARVAHEAEIALAVKKVMVAR
jgi:hypothetical protein